MADNPELAKERGERARKRHDSQRFALKSKSFDLSEYPTTGERLKNAYSAFLCVFYSRFDHFSPIRAKTAKIDSRRIYVPPAYVLVFVAQTHQNEPHLRHNPRHLRRQCQDLLSLSLTLGLKTYNIMQFRGAFNLFSIEK